MNWKIVLHPARTVEADRISTVFMTISECIVAKKHEDAVKQNVRKLRNGYVQYVADLFYSQHGRLVTWRARRAVNSLSEVNIHFDQKTLKPIRNRGDRYEPVGQPGFHVHKWLQLKDSDLLILYALETSLDILSKYISPVTTYLGVV